MPNPVNISNQVESTSPNTESVNATLVKNTVDTQLNGTSPVSQNYILSFLESSDYSSIAQAQQQSNYFISQTDKPPVGSSYSDYSSFSQNPVIVADVGIPYNYASDMSAESKDQRVTTDYKMKEDTSMSVKWGDSAISDGIDTIKEESPNSTSVMTLYRDASNWGLKGSITKGREDKNTDWCVTIEEDRESIDKVATEGTFGTDRVSVRVYQRVNNFSFGTTQSLQNVEPRGSQTPLRFYDKNQGRTLNFTAEFHQQEFPLEPLLSIAEKLQYLARPYQHGDYSLIPKMVRITIPGRTFRGFLINADVTYQGEDYTSWNSEEIKAALTNDVVSSWGNTYRSFAQMAEDRGKHGYTYVGNLNSSDAIHYGLERIAVTLVLAIVEEIKLAQYVTYAEQQAQYIMNNQEKAAEMQAEVLESWAEASYQVGMYMMTEEGQSLLDENGRPYSERTPEELIYVDIATGEVFRDSQGNIMTVYNSSPDNNMMTLDEYMKSHEIKGSNTQNSNEDIYQKVDPEIYESRDLNVIQLRSEILKLAKASGMSTAQLETLKTELESITDIKRLNEIYKEYFNLVYSSKDATSSKFVSDCCTFVVPKKDASGVDEVITYVPTEIKELFSYKIETFDDAMAYLAYLGIGKTIKSLGAFSELYVIVRRVWSMADIVDKMLFRDILLEYFNDKGYGIELGVSSGGNSTLNMGEVETRYLPQKYKDYCVSLGGKYDDPDFKDLVRDKDDYKAKYTILSDLDTGLPLEKPDTTILDFITSLVKSMSQSFPNLFYDLLKPYVPCYSSKEMASQAHSVYGNYPFYWYIGGSSYK